MTRPRPFNISIFVVDGRPDGLRLIEKSNWIGFGVVCPRLDWPTARDRPEFDRSGVYILTGRGDGDLPTVYVGEAEHLRKRVNTHHANKDFWQSAIAFTSRGNSLNKAEVRYLECRLIELAREFRRCNLDNEVAPQRPNLSEPDQAEMEGFLEEMRSLLPVLGVMAFQPLVSQRTEETSSLDTIEFRCTGPGCDAVGRLTTDGFVVLAGSRARGTVVDSMERHARNYFERRAALVESGCFEHDGDQLVLTQDREFSSPSFAAAVFLGRNANGWKEWKDASGRDLHALRDQEATSG